MPSATRTATVVAAALPLLVLLVGRHHDGSAAEPQPQPVPAHCFVTGIYDHVAGADTMTGAFPDLDAAQADLARQARELTAADEHENPQFRAQAEAALALSRPGADRTVRGGSVLLTVYDDHHHVVAEATYGPPGIFLEPTPADGYVLQSLTFPVEPLPGRTNCATPLAG